MKRYLYTLTIIVIVVAALVAPLESDSFTFRGGEDRDFRKITIVAPLGGEQYIAGSKQKISWQVSRSIRYVKIEYSIDNGKQWLELVKNLKMDTTFGEHEWEVPCSPTSKAKIRVSDVYGPDYDVIIKSFSIICDSKTGKEN